MGAKKPENPAHLYAFLKKTFSGAKIGVFFSVAKFF